MYSVRTKDFKITCLPQNEILRYMRAGQSPSEEVLWAAREGEARVLRAAVCRACWVRAEVEHISDERVKICGIEMKSRDLARRLDGCEEAFIFAATAGVGVDREIRLCATVSPLLSLACDAAGSALAEQLCDALEDELMCEAQTDGKQTVKRFSAGYGDLSLEYQRDIAALLSIAKNIGASLTDGVMMTPSKTVTAIVGVR